MPLLNRYEVEGLWNSKKERLQQLQDRLSKTPSRHGSAGSDRVFASPFSDTKNLRRGNKPPVPPVSSQSNKKAEQVRSSTESDSISSEEIEFVSSPQIVSNGKKKDRRKTHRRSMIIQQPQPPTVFYAPPPMQPLYYHQTMPIPISYMPHPMHATTFPTAVPGPNVVPKKSNLKGRLSDEESEEKAPQSRRKRTKTVRIVEEKEAVDAGTSTDELNSNRQKQQTADNQIKSISKEVEKALHPMPSKNDTNQPPLYTAATPLALPSATSQPIPDDYFVPRIAPPLVFETVTVPTDANLQSARLETLSMFSNPAKPHYPTSTFHSQVGQITIETSSRPSQMVYQPKHPDTSTTLNESSSAADDRTVDWVSSDHVRESKKKSKLMTPIAEEILKSYDVLKSDIYGAGDDSNTAGDLDSANQRLSRYFNQLRDLDHFILDQEAKLLDRHQSHVEKRTKSIRPAKNSSFSPRRRHSPIQRNLSSSPPSPAPKIHAHIGTSSGPMRQSALLIEQLYGSTDKNTGKELLRDIEESPSPKPSRHHDEKTTPRQNDLLDEILTFEVGRVVQATSIEAVSALIEKKLAEDLEEKRAMTKRIIEKLPSPEKIIEQAFQKTEETVQAIVEETAMSLQMKPPPVANKPPAATTPVEDVDMFFRELTLPRTAESVVKDVIDVDLRVLTKEIMLELSIESVVDDFLINQVVAVEMLKIAAEAFGEVERRKKRSRRRQMKDAIDGPVLHSMLLDIALARVAQQSLILTPQYEIEMALYDNLLQVLVGKTLGTLTSRALVAECLPMRRYHEKVVSDIAMDAVVNELIKSLDIDMAEIDDFETGRDLEFAKTPLFSRFN